MPRSAHVDTFARDHLPPRSQWPDFLESPDTRYPARMNAAVELLDAMIAKGHGDSIALINDQGHCTWRQLGAQVDRIAHALTGPMGLVPGNRVLLRGGNNPMMAACWLATVKAGLIAVATMPLLRAAELKQLAEKAQINAVLCDLKLRDEIDVGARDCARLQGARFFNDGSGASDALETYFPKADSPFTACNTASDDVALIAFTSGTTGQP
ncbi:MAG: AMP-binding protein, partial [Betaproteobacteria bacterium]